MPLTLKKDAWNVRDPASGSYRSAAILSTTLPEDAAQIIEDTQSALDAEEVRAGQIINDAQNAVDGIEGQSTIILESIAKAIQDGDNYELIDTAVESWLDAHPEATTTVQDGSLNKDKFTNSLKLESIKDYVTPQMYGAVADGITDDTNAFQLAISSGKPVFVPAGDYYIENIIDNPSTFTLVGSGRNYTKIKLGNSLLKNEITQTEISNIYFYCNQNNTITVFPADIVNCKIMYNAFRYFYTIFSRIRICSIICGNYVVFLQHLFCSSIVDSFVINNYINAPKVNNPQTVCFASVIHTTIANNFIDYMYKVFACEDNAIKNVSVTGNIFDVCYSIFYGAINSVTFTGNTLSNMTKSDSWDVSGNNEMNTTRWSVIHRPLSGSRSIVNSTFANNSFSYLEDIDMYFYADSNGYPTKFFKIDDKIPANKIEFKAYKSQNLNDLEGIIIQPLLKRTVTSLPSPALTGNVVSFNYDEVIYNNDLYININGVWKQLSNTT